MVTDKSITDRISRFAGLKSDFRQRQEMVRALSAAGLPGPDSISGEGGVPVTVPRAERYAVHKLIVAVERREQAKAGKDIMQAGTLIAALAKKRPIELAEAWQTAWKAGPRWKEKLESGRARLSDAARAALDGAAEKAAESRKRRRRA